MVGELDHHEKDSHEERKTYIFPGVSQGPAKVLRPLDVGISNRFSILLMLMVLKLLPLLNMITTTQRR